MKSLFALFMLVVTCAAYPQVMPPRSDLSVTNYMLQVASQRALITDPTTSSKCFSLHLPLLEKIANQFSVDYNRCVSAASSQRDDVIAAMKDEHDALSSAATGICQYVSTCQNIEDTMDFFNCFSKLGKKSMSIVYTISNNASDAATHLLQQLELVDVEMYKCTNISERTYIKNSANIYDALDKCLHSGPPDITNTTTTTVKTTLVTEEESTAEVTWTIDDRTTASDISSTDLGTVSSNIDSEPSPEEDIR